eukprot:CAMPEP_0180810030 /NCGR_PEP_ID=MMETSP1038_2-20121128/64648_1 /TAXON_ID=632150 /ORGANISM="Azadinium spinosum, Strain 3D9" /LENGTH=58 /DNA_ID=CAMNT_0022851255 /DNA_START=108 /DNA_END=282 /DNA_ORIENTATION=-
MDAPVTGPVLAGRSGGLAEDKGFLAAVETSDISSQMTTRLWTPGPALHLHLGAAFLWP